MSVRKFQAGIRALATVLVVVVVLGVLWVAQATGRIGTSTQSFTAGRATATRSVADDDDDDNGKPRKKCKRRYRKDGRPKKCRRDDNHHDDDDD